MAFTLPSMEAWRELLLGGQFLYGFSPATLGVGVDLPGGHGAAVRAPISGRVVTVQGDQGQGAQLEIVGANGWTVLLGKLGDLYNYDPNRPGAHDYHSIVQAGQLVHMGDLLGHQGSQGTHFGIQDPTGAWRDPGGSVQTLFYNFYHSIGGGGPWNPGQYDTPPDPLHLPTGGLPPTITYHEQPTGNSAGVPGLTLSGGPYGEPVGTGGPDIPEDPIFGTICRIGKTYNPADGKCHGASGLEGPNLTPQLQNILGPDPFGINALMGHFVSWGPAIVLALVGGVLVIGGVFALTRTAPGQSVTHTAKEAALVAA